MEGAARRELAGESLSIPEPEPAAAASSSPPTRLRGRCVDPADRPLEGVVLHWVELGTSAASGADGHFELELELPGTWPEREVYLRVSHSGRATQILRKVVPRGESVDLGDIVLALGGAISGHVVDSSGRAVAGAIVVCSDEAPSALRSPHRGPSRRLVETWSDAAGAFRLDGVPAWPVRAWAQAEGHLWAIGEPLLVPANEERYGVELVLEPLEREDTIELTVHGPDGEPLPDAIVRCWFHGNSYAGNGEGRADGTGRYVHQVLMAVPHDFTADDPEGRFRSASVGGIEPGARDLVLRLGEARWLELRVGGPDGEPIERFVARAGVRHGSYTDSSRVAALSPEDPGVARLLLPADPFTLRVSARGYDAKELGPFDPESVASPLEVRLERLAMVRGRVTAAGEPLRGARVGLHGERGSDSRQVLRDGFPARSECSAQVTATSGADGTFELELRSSGRYYLRAEGNGWAPTDIGPLDLSAEAGASGLEIDLGHGGTIEGRVLLPPGESPAGVLVGYSRGDGCPRTIATDDGGRFRLPRLTPGPWLLERRQREIEPGRGSTWSVERDSPAGEMPWSCEVREGETTRFDLDLRFERRTVLLGRVVLGGEPATGWYATLLPLDGPGERLQASIDGEGRFRVESNHPGRRSLRISNGAWSPAALRISDTVLLSSGENSWELDLPLGSLTATLPAIPAAGYRYIWNGEGALEVSVGGIEPGPDGRVTITVPAGTGTLESNEADPVTVEVPEGGTVEVEM